MTYTYGRHEKLISIIINLRRSYFFPNCSLSIAIFTVLDDRKKSQIVLFLLPRWLLWMIEEKEL